MALFFNSHLDFASFLEYSTDIFDGLFDLEVGHNPCREGARAHA